MVVIFEAWGGDRRIKAPSQWTRALETYGPLKVGKMWIFLARNLGVQGTHHLLIHV